MAEIANTPPNGFNVVSTFSGCGGSCLGFKMAGFRHLWASEFIEAARDTYRTNFPAVTLDGRDIREVSVEDILTATGLAPGQLDVLEGSPPCSSFSTAGVREKHWGKAKQYSNKTQRTDDLFFEFLRLVEGLKPKVVVAENVSGLIKGAAKGYFVAIRDRFIGLGYRFDAKVLDAQWLGVPQQRARVIIVAVREDLGKAPRFPAPLPYRYSVRDALAGLADPAVIGTRFGAPRSPDEPAPTVMTHGNLHTRSELSIAEYAIGKEALKLKQGEQSDKYFSLVRASENEPCPTITQLGAWKRGAAGVIHPTEMRKFSVAEVKRICSFPDDFVLMGTSAQQWERLGRAVPPVMMKTVAEQVRAILEAP
jgi:DNA (cytosine-5)-methyltransferase 1